MFLDIPIPTGDVGKTQSAVGGTVEIPVNSTVEIDTGLSEINQFVLFGYRTNTDASSVCIAIYNKDASTTTAVAAYNGNTITYRNMAESAYVTNGNIISAINGGKVTVIGVKQSGATPNGYHWFAC